MTDWRIKDYQARCFNLQNKLNLYNARESKLRKRMREICKEKNCDELTAWKILKNELEAEIRQRQMQRNETF